MSEHDHEPTVGGDDDVERDSGWPSETRSALRAAWRSLPTPPSSRELAQEDEATRRAVGWMSAAWLNPAVLAPPQNARRAPAPVIAMAGSAFPDGRLSGWRRQVAAAAVLLLLLGAALALSSLLPATRSTGDNPAPPVATDSTQGVGAPVSGAQRNGAPGDGSAGSGATDRAAPALDAPWRAASGDTTPPAVPRTFDARPSSLTVAAAPPPIELRSGSVRLLLFTDATRQIPENQP